jgi:hypothetical protein
MPGVTDRIGAQTAAFALIQHKETRT